MAKGLRKRLQFSCAAAALSAAFSAAAFAQSRLDDVVVTSERRPENLRDVPLSVATIAGEKLDVLNSSGLDIRFLSARVPSLNIESSFGRTFPRFYIRGLGNSDFDLNASQPVSILFDDIVQENPILKGFPVFDTAQVEVLRGPQGTLFGRNTPAGVIKFTSNAPSESFEAYGNLGYGSYDTVNFEGAVGGPLGPRDLFGRASVLIERRDNFVDNIPPVPARNKALEGYADFAGRLQLLWQPDFSTEITLNLHGRDLDGTARVFRANIIQPGTNNLVPGFQFDKAYTDGTNQQRVKVYGSTLKVDHNFGPISVISVTGYERGQAYSRGDIDGGYGGYGGRFNGPGPLPFFSESADSVPALDQFTEEVRYQTNNNGRLSNQGGIFIFNEHLRVDSRDFTEPAEIVDILVHQKQNSTSGGVFETLSYQLSSDLQAGAGLRYSEDRKWYNARRDFGFLGPATYAQTVHGAQMTYDAHLVWSVDDATNLFFRVGSGYRPPSIQGRILFANGISTARAERVTSYEGGIKSELLDSRAEWNTSVYAYDNQHQQLTATGGGGNVAQLVNAAHVSGYGFESDLELKPLESTLITAGVSYNHTKIEDPNLAVGGCGAPCHLLNPAGPIAGTVLVNGNPLPQAPLWIWNLTARYGVPVGAGGEVFVYTDWAYRSNVDFFLYKATEFDGKSLLEGGLRIGYVDHDRGYEVAAFVRNIANEIRVIGGIDFDNFTGMVNEPRVIGVQAKLKF